MRRESVCFFGFQEGVFQTLFLAWQECGVLFFVRACGIAALLSLRYCAIAVFRPFKTFFCKLFKKRGGRDYADGEPIFMISLFLGIVLGLVAGFSSSLHGSAILYFGGFGWWIAWLALFTVIFLTVAVLDDDFSLIGLLANIFLGLVLGYLVFFLLAYLIAWLLKVVFCLLATFLTWLFGGPGKISSLLK